MRGERFLGAAKLRLRLAAVVLVGLAVLVSVRVARAETALEWAAAEASRAHSFGHRLMVAETGESRLLNVAKRYIGSRRFTPLPRAWCADAVGAWLHQAGYSSTGDGRAISYARYGRATSAHVGAIAVLPHHVGVVAGFDRRGLILVSGNHNHRVGVGVYSARRILAFREPV